MLLFVKYVSDKYAGNHSAMLEVPVGGGFADMIALKGDKEIGDKLNIIIRTLAEANGLTGVIDVADFNDAEKQRAKRWWIGCPTWSAFSIPPASTSKATALRGTTSSAMLTNT